MIVIIADNTKDPVLFVRAIFKDDAAEFAMDFSSWGLTPELPHAIHFGSKQFAEELLSFVKTAHPNAYMEEV